jgi:acyl-homoserine-lactone acylase
VKTVTNCLVRGFCCGFLALFLATPLFGARAELLWDRYGVAHIFAADAASAFRAFGYAQMSAHGDLILRLYGQARGRAAEYWGQSYVASDRWVRVNGIPDRAVAWLDAQKPAFRANLTAFADGMNTYAREHPEQLSDESKRALPVTAADVLAHTQRVIDFTFVTSMAEVQARLRSAPVERTGASNAWALSKPKTKKGASILLANPHLPWSDYLLFFEAQIKAPGIDAYGATLVGFPVLGIAFNDHLAWTLTVNNLHAADLFELTPAGEGYLFDGETRSFDATIQTIKVRQANGSLSENRITFRRSVQGPIVGERNGHPVALHVPSLAFAGMCQEWWDMARATNLAEFESALSRLEIPMFNIVYADRAGHIMYVYNGVVPVRSGGSWSASGGLVSGDRSDTLPTKIHSYGDLPRLIDPASGWLQNTNDGPWTATLPMALDPSKYPSYMAPPVAMNFRTQRSIRMLTEQPTFSLEDVVQDKYSTRAEVADHMLDALIQAARASRDLTAVKAANILQAWDRTTDSNSRGAVLFAEFLRLWEQPDPFGPPALFEIGWKSAAPLATPSGLADPARAVRALIKAGQSVEENFGSMEVPWGNVFRFRNGDKDLPGNGGPGSLGVFRVVNYAGSQDRPAAIGGDSFVMAVEFTTPVRAVAVLGYGNASQPHSDHRTDQMDLMSAKQMRPVWRSRAAVMKNLETRVTLKVP